MSSPKSTLTSTMAATLAAALLAVLASPARAGDLEDARALQSKRSWEAAAAKYEKLAEADPANAAAALGWAECLIALGKYELAARKVGGAFDANPADASLRLVRARAWYLSGLQVEREGGDGSTILGNMSEAVRWSRKAIEIDPANSAAKVLCAQALLYKNQGELKETMDLLNEVVAKDPKCFDAHFELGQIAFNAGRRDRTQFVAAEKHFRDAFTVDPTSGAALLRATWSKQWQGKAPAAELIDDYLAAGKLLPEDTGALTAIFKLRKSKGCEDKAVAALAALQSVNKRAKTYACTAEAERLAAGGKGGPAVDKAVEGVKAWGEGDIANELNVILADIAWNPGTRIDGKERDLLGEAMWKAWPNRVENPSNAGVWWRDIGKDAKRAVTWYLRAAEAAPESPQVLNDTGVVYDYNLGEPEKAEPWYRKAIEKAQEQGLEPSNDAKDVEGMGYRDALNNLGKLLFVQKRWKDLKAHAESAPDGFPAAAGWLRAADEHLKN
ncbi:MAG: hypothetical protein HMLKMBBP_01990 [Planctomycetes bacterium]|nr:hypothetical protein [Planctomycetota bacterium]